MGRGEEPRGGAERAVHEELRVRASSGGGAVGEEGRDERRSRTSWGAGASSGPGRGGAMSSKADGAQQNKKLN